ncbi:MAG: hypothetical protein RLZZ511_139 [Cyanobacteriota bacterium]
MEYFACPYLQTTVELTHEREQHILDRHPDLPDSYLSLIEQTLLNPDEVRCDQRFEETWLFSRWFSDIRRGRFLVVAVVSDHQGEATLDDRHWIVTAYLSNRVTQGDVVWTAT